MGVFTYREIQDTLFKQKEKYRKQIQSNQPQVDKDYCRYGIWVITESQKEFKKLLYEKLNKD